jgi:adenylate cyclase, class 2
MLEVEMKFPAAEPEAIVALLLGLGAVPHAPRIEVDHYFNAPDRDFAQTDEALRLRSIDQENAITYKGPKLDTQTKTRVEIEKTLAPGCQAAEVATALLISLGYRPTAHVRKQRQTYGLTFQDHAVEVCLDQVDDVGSYVEIEIIAPHERIDAARETVLALAQQLGLGPTERRSYLQLLLERRRPR